MEKAFTLIELLVVIAIIGILAGMVVVNMSGATDKARIAKAQNFSSGIQHKLGLAQVGYWNFNEGSGTAVVDVSGNSNNGTTSGGVVYSTSTPSGNGINGEYSLSFNGTSGYVSIPVLTFPGEYTMEFWAFRSVNSSYHFVLGHSSYNGKIGFNTGNDLLFIRPNDIGSGGTLSLSVPSNQWAHIAVSRDAGNVVRVYINGKENILFGGAAQSGTLSIDRIGVESGGWRFNGLIDEVKIYNQTLSSLNIKKNYLAGLDGLLNSEKISQESYNEMRNNMGYASNE